MHSLVPGVIASDELEGLQAVLRLLRQIVKQVSHIDINYYEGFGGTKLYMCFCMHALMW